MRYFSRHCSIGGNFPHLRFSNRATILITLLLLAGTARLEAQSCTECGNRTLSVYKMKINAMSPVAGDRASILNFYNALTVGSSIMKYLTTTDPTRGCVQTAGYDLSTVSTDWAVLYPSTLNALAASLKESPSGEIPEYWIGGTVTPVLLDPLQYVLSYQCDLRTAGNEIVASVSGTVDFYPVGDVYSSVSTTLSGQLGPVYEKLHEFEVRKRDTGAPFAINPRVSCKWPSHSLDFNEKITLHFTMLDCDDVPLKNRVVTVDGCDLGTLNKMSFTTDDNGEADLEYTAPPMTAGIATIHMSYAYAEPWNAPGVDEVKHGTIEIEIKAPADSWSLHATYAYTRTGNTSEFHSTGTSSSSQVYETQANVVDAWLKRVVIPYTPRSYFVAQPTPLATAFSGHKISNGRNNVLFTGTNGYAKSDGWFDTFAQVESTATPTYALSINNSVQFSFQGFSARQTGMSHTTDESYDPVRGYQTSSSNTPAPLTTLCNWSTMGFPFDTSYSSHTFDGINYDSASYVQTCTWDDSASFLLKQEKHFVSESTVDTTEEAPGGGVVSIKQHSITFKTFRINIEMKYHKGTPDGIAVANDVLPKEYVLFHNYPNPFNPSTTISFSLPSRSFVSLKLFDALGREVAIVCSEELPAGMHSRQWNAGGFPSGVYFYRLQAGGYSNTKALQLLK